ncbi:phosphodiester glycosidase family protein [Kineosporia sp. R_H_3]|uniref:phosphodiester glycosidase family protein n=1 Tax=Kineosporia sp. R_H_3 TaxID=1961848 RepID=UPI00117BDB3A|nr:phosphodiester glycosidase family protein [Kineosporia sp. R_H_3]
MPAQRRRARATPAGALAVAALAAALGLPSPGPSPVPSGGPAPAHPSVLRPALGPVSDRASLWVSCPDTFRVDWAHPTVVLDDDAVTVRQYSAAQQGGRVSRVTVAAAHRGSSRLVARGAPLIGGVRTTSGSVRPSPTIVVGVNGGYFWRGEPGREWSKGTQVRRGRVLHAPAGRTRYVGAETTGAVSKGFAHVSGSVTVRATASAPAVRLPVVAVNSAASGNGVAVYTREWSNAQRRTGGTWEVAVRSGVVIAAGPRVTTRLGGTAAAENRFVVRASGTAAAALRRVRVGQRATYTARAVTDAGGVVAESTVAGTTLLAEGRQWIRCAKDTIRPRTMVAWDRRSGAVWLVTVSGGTGSWRYGVFVGASHHQMAAVARGLGATDAVLLDGGGSTTMVLRTASGALRRVDGPFVTQRELPDILGIAAA